MIKSGSTGINCSAILRLYLKVQENIIIKISSKEEAGSTGYKTVIDVKNCESHLHI